MTRWSYLGGLGGALAFALAAGIAELAAAIAMIVSPRVAVGDGVIHLAPAAVVHFATGTFGTADKPILLATIVAITLVFGAVIGTLARRRFEVATYGFGVWWVVCGVAVWADQTDSSAAIVVTGLGAAAGLGALRLMLTRIPLPRSIDADGSTAPPRRADPRQRMPDRRRFMQLAAASAGASVAAVAGARTLGGRDVDVEAQRQVIALPVPASPLPAVAPTAALDVANISPLVTANKAFYRIDTALSVPRVDVQKWRLRITGMVERPQEFTYSDLTAMAAVEADATLACVSNEVGGGLVGNARWLGIPLRTLLDRAGVKPGATQVIGRSVDGFTAGFPTEVALDGRAAMVALGMNGEALPAAHGFPARLVVPGLYGYVSATKWLASIDLTTLEAFDAYWIPRGWSKLGPIKTQSRIDVPSFRSRLPAGRVPIAGVAWGGVRSISRVDVRVTPNGEADGPWMPARLSDALSQSTWRQWVVEWDATPGDYRIAVRATDGTGETQTSDLAGVAPDGATGWHTIWVRVS